MRKNTKNSDRAPKPTASQRLASVLGVPLSAMGDIPFMELTGNRELIVDGCKGILTYDDDVIKLNTGKLTVLVRGRGLVLKSFSENAVSITGFFISIEFTT